MTHLFPHIFSLSTECFFHWKCEMVALYPAKLLVSFVLDTGKKKSCFPSFVSWREALIAPCLGLTVLTSTPGPEQLSSSTELITHNYLREKCLLSPKGCFLLGSLSFAVFLSFISQIFSAETGRSSRCWGPGSTGYMLE